MGLAVWLGFCCAAPSPRAEAEPSGGRGESLEYDATRNVWVEQEPPVPGTPEGDLRLARADHAEGKCGAAEQRIRRWIKTYGDGDALYPEAALLRARIEVARRDYYKAHKHLQELLNEYSGTQVADEAIHYEFVIAEVFLKGTRRKVLGLPILPAQDLGVRILDELAANHPESSVAELAMKTKADYFFHKGDFSLAEIEYARLREQFGRSRYLRYALRRSAEAALASFPGIEFDDAPLIEAEARFREYVAQYPGSAEQEGVGLVLENIREQRAAKELHIGDFYQRTRHERAATFYYRSTITNWPETLAARKAAGRMSKLSWSEAPQVAGEAEMDAGETGEDQPSESEEKP